MKKKVFYIAIVIVCLCLITAGTVAYFTDEDRAHNVITTGAVTISVEEWRITENGEMVPYPKDPVEVMPGCDVSKIVTVKNEDEASLVRVSYDIVVMDKDGNVMELSEEELNKYIVITPDLADWEVKAEFDGWYYYKNVLETGDTTAPLFEEVSFSAKMGNEFEEATFKVNVVAQAVQAKNNALSAIDAMGWPDE